MKYTYEQPDYLDANGVRHLVQELKQYIFYILDGNIDITQYATKDELKFYAKKADIPNMDAYATKSYVDDAVTKVATGGEVDLSNYYNKQEVDARIPDVITKDEIKALFAEEELATETYVDNAVANVPITDLSNYYTKDEVYNKEETDELIANSGGGDTPVDPEPIILGTVSISGRTDLKCGFTREYTGSFVDTNENLVDGVSGTFTISNCSFAESKFTTKEIGTNAITLGVDDEDLIGETFTLTFGDVDGKYTPASITITIAEAF